MCLLSMLTSAGATVIPTRNETYHTGKTTTALRQVRSTDQSRSLGKDQPMMDMSKEHLNGERDSLFTDFPDETLENAAHTTSKSANYTLGACTGLSVCPACCNSLGHTRRQRSKPSIAKDIAP